MFQGFLEKQCGAPTLHRLTRSDARAHVLFLTVILLHQRAGSISFKGKEGSYQIDDECAVCNVLYMQKERSGK